MGTVGRCHGPSTSAHHSSELAYQDCKQPARCQETQKWEDKLQQAKCLKVFFFPLRKKKCKDLRAVDKTGWKSGRAAGRWVFGGNGESGREFRREATRIHG